MLLQTSYNDFVFTNLFPDHSLIFYSSFSTNNFYFSVCVWSCLSVSDTQFTSKYFHFYRRSRYNSFVMSDDFYFCVKFQNAQLSWQGDSQNTG